MAAIAWSVAAIILTLAIGSSATQVFVSTKGSDTAGDGSAAHPFATVGRAQQLVRTINKNMNADITVYILEGSYFLSQPLSLLPEDSGTNGFTIHYASYPGDHVVLHSGVQVGGWQPLAGSSSIWVAALPSGVADARQAYINGVRMVPTNTGAGLPGRVTITATGYTTTDPLAAFFNAEQNAADIEFLYTGVGSSWTECRVRVASIERLPAGGANITMQQPGFSLARNRFYGQGVSSPASVANVFSLLGAGTPGQYYLNSHTRQIFYVPRPSEDMRSSVVMVPQGDVLVLAQGDTSAPAINPVRFIAFEALTFSYAGWLEPNSGLGYVDMQSGFRVLPSSTVDDRTWVPVPGNLRFHTVENLTISNCTFTHLGATAVEIDNGSQSIKVINNTFLDISCGGVYVGQVNDANVTDPTRENGHAVIHNNYFNSIPVEYRDCAPIVGGFMVDTNITHNTILNNPNTGISLGWGWSRDEAVNAGWNNIVANYVDGSNWLLEDGGSLYVLGPQPGSLMADNYISNQKKLFGALYTDEGSAYWHITRCVVDRCPEWLHIWTSTIHDEVVDFCWSNQQYQDVHGTRITIANITFVPLGQPFPPAAQAVMAAAGVDWMAGPKHN